ncbi:hypothetical protein Hanom_Chr11g00984671 [Helianthus anomalus]
MAVHLSVTGVGGGSKAASRSFCISKSLICIFHHPKFFPSNFSILTFPSSDIFAE